MPDGLSPGKEAHPEGGGQLPGFGKASGVSSDIATAPLPPSSPGKAESLPFQLPQRMRARGHSANIRTPTCKVDTSTGPLSCPTRKNSTVTVFFSVRREAPERWVKSGKARARAQAEAKASDRSQTICSTERQSRERGQTRECGQTHGSGTRGRASVWTEEPRQSHHAGAFLEPPSHRGRKRRPPDVDCLRGGRVGRRGAWAQEIWV